MTYSDIDTCNVFGDLVPLYIDGVCSDDSKRMIEGHMEQCHFCQRRYEAMKAGVPLDQETIEQSLKAKEIIDRLQRKGTLRGLPKFVLGGVIFGVAIGFLLWLTGANDNSLTLNLAGWTIGCGLFNIVIWWCWPLLLIRASSVKPRQGLRLVLYIAYRFSLFLVLFGLWSLGYFWNNWIPAIVLVIAAFGAASVLRLSKRLGP